MSALAGVLAECAAAPTCPEFVEKGGEQVAVVRAEDLLAYCEAKGIGPFRGKRQMMYGFVRSRDGKVLMTYTLGSRRYYPSSEYRDVVARFLGTPST